MPKITNKNYKQFMDEGIIEPLTHKHIDKALKNITKQKHDIKEGQALLCTLYLTGARPNEVLQLKAEDITKEASYIIIHIKGSKRGLPRPLYFQNTNKYARIIYNYAIGIMPEAYLYYHYKSQHTKTVRTKQKNGLYTIKEYTETTTRIRYYIKKWFENVLPDSIPPYFLRHNRISKLALNGATDRELQQFKGSKTITSIQPYIHMSSKSAKNLASKIK